MEAYISNDVVDYFNEQYDQVGEFNTTQYDWMYNPVGASFEYLDP